MFVMFYLSETSNNAPNNVTYYEILHVTILEKT